MSTTTDLGWVTSLESREEESKPCEHQACAERLHREADNELMVDCGHTYYMCDDHTRLEELNVADEDLVITCAYCTHYVNSVIAIPIKKK